VNLIDNIYTVTQWYGPYTLERNGMVNLHCNTMVWFIYTNVC